jgi:hypothetical protein
MQTYEFIFHCERCGREVTERVTPPEVLTRKELNQLPFRVTCKDGNCGWITERTGLDAEKKKATIRPIAALA